MSDEKKAGRRTKIERARKLWAQAEQMVASGLARDVTITIHVAGGSDITVSTRTTKRPAATGSRGRGRAAGTGALQAAAAAPHGE